MTRTPRETLLSAVQHVLCRTDPEWVKNSPLVLDAVLDRLREPNDDMIAAGLTRGDECRHELDDGVYVPCVSRDWDEGQILAEQFRAAIDTLREGRG